MVSKKLAALVAAGAVAVPGVAYATHDSGKAGAPGVVCKSVRTDRAAAVKQARSEGKKGKEIAALVKVYNAAYKGCVRAAADARSHD